MRAHVCALLTEGSPPEPRHRPAPKTLDYQNFTSHIHYRLPSTPISPQDNEIFSRIIHPYNSKAFEVLLLKHDLLDSYKFLIRNLCCGFPLGTLPLLSRSVIICNHLSVEKFPRIIKDYLSDEIQIGCMSGPFSQSHVECILRGPLYASPLIVSEQSQGTDVPPKFRVCHNLSKDDPITRVFSVNSFIDKDNFPTRFDVAHLVAEQVCL